jgi:hypothetical protein
MKQAIIQAIEALEYWKDNLPKSSCNAVGDLVLEQLYLQLQAKPAAYLTHDNGLLLHNRVHQNDLELYK